MKLNGFVVFIFFILVTIIIINYYNDKIRKFQSEKIEKNVYMSSSRLYVPNGKIPDV